MATTLNKCGSSWPDPSMQHHPSLCHLQYADIEKNKKIKKVFCKKCSFFFFGLFMTGTVYIEDGKVDGWC